MLKTASSGGGGGGGGITQIVAGLGLNGGTITSTGTLSNAGVLAIGSATGSLATGFGLIVLNGTLQTTVTIPIPGNGTSPTL